ncbi:MAG: thioesterase family protein [Verrucomicrobiota bacterium JB023]|nr:thioesterase family protein [Verrucomicrobiota bacterium JB023]
MMRHECEILEEVMFYDTDCGAVVHNLAYLRMIEKCRTMLAGSMGFNLREMSETGIFPVVVHTEADYRKPTGLGDFLRIKGWLAEWGKARFWCEFEIHRDADLVLTARQSLAVLKMPEGKIQRLGPLPALA